jgi:hypothetical protein
MRSAATRNRAETSSADLTLSLPLRAQAALT